MPDALHTRVLPTGPGWIDRRLTAVRHNEFAHRIEPPRSIEEWTERKERARNRVLLSAGLVPFPDKSPLRPDLGPWYEHEGCRIANVAFESRPGLHLAGNLYAPLRDSSAPCPAILSPHGHWPRGRLHHDDRGSIPVRCMMLARLGFVVFAYDMIGYNDSGDLMHRLPDDLSRLAAVHGLSIFGLQLWNSIRATDFLAALPMVDSTRIGCTGASGGASQTWNLAITDERITVLAPVCMLSAHFQGGCPCEEGPLLRLEDLTSAELLMALAPRPLLLPSVTQDWTNLNPVYEFGLVREAYRLWGAEDRIAQVHFDAPHNYNRRTREYVYGWFVRWLAGDSSAPARIAEPDLTPPAEERLRLCPRHRKPTLVRTRKALNILAEEAVRPFRDPPVSAAAWRRLCTRLKPLYEGVFAPVPPPANVAVRVTYGHTVLPQCRIEGRTLSRRGVGDVVPALWISPTGGTTPRADVVVAATPAGKSGLFAEGMPTPVLQCLLDAGFRVLAIDLLGTGDTEPQKSLLHDDRDDRLWYAFNPALPALRVHDVLTAVQGARESGRHAVHLLATGEAARIAALAVPLAGPLASVSLDLEGVADTPAAWSGESYQPFALKAGGLHGALALGAPTRLLLRRPPPALGRWVRGIYGACDRIDDLQICKIELERALHTFLR